MKVQITQMTAAILAVALLASCASEAQLPPLAARDTSHKTTQSNDADGSAASDASGGGATDEASFENDATTDGAVSGKGTEGSRNNHSNNKGQDDRKLTGPEPLDLPWESTLDLSATVTPTCVEPGGTMLLEVETNPESAVGYQAVYADNRGGAKKPYGGGYGGNDKGVTNADGGFESSWIVASHTPIGPGRVDVIIAYEGEWGYAEPVFRVDDQC